MDVIHFLKEIHLLLQHHECVIVPNFGGFITHYEPARIDKTKDLFFPPYKGVIFNPHLTKNDGLLIHYLMEKYDVDFDVVSKKIELSVEQLKIDLAQNKKVIIEKVGTLSINEDGYYHFQQDDSHNLLEEAFALNTFHSPAIHKEETILKKEKVFTLRKPLKWVAILIPFLFLGYWFIANNSTIHQKIKTYYSSFIPSNSIFNSHRAFADISFIKSCHSENNIALISNEDNIPIRVTTKEVLQKIKQQIKAQNLSFGKEYCIITGVFKDKRNAEKYIRKMEQYNYKPFLAGQNRSGLIRVALDSSKEKSVALHLLEDIRKKFSPDAWLFRY